MRTALISIALLFAGCQSTGAGGFISRLHLVDWEDPDSGQPTAQEIADQRSDILKKVENGTIPITYPVKR